MPHDTSDKQPLLVSVCVLNGENKYICLYLSDIKIWPNADLLQIDCKVSIANKICYNGVIFTRDMNKYDIMPETKYSPANDKICHYTCPFC